MNAECINITIPRTSNVMQPSLLICDQVVLPSFIFVDIRFSLKGEGKEGHFMI